MLALALALTGICYGGSAEPVDAPQLATCGLFDSDCDDDGVLDADDYAPNDPYQCMDADGDGCDDCAFTGADGSGGDVSADGIDTDNDGQCDIGDLDLDGDGLPNWVENRLFIAPEGDADGDGIPNYHDADDRGDGQPADCTDDSGDGCCSIIDRLYDADDDTIPNHLDLDSDGDGLPDYYEAGHGVDSPANDGRIGGPVGMNGLTDEVETEPDTGMIYYHPADTDNDMTPDFLDDDSDGDGIADAVEAGTDESPGASARDSDSDGVPDFLDLDSDNDGRTDADEAGSGESGYRTDSDGDGVPDYRDADSGNDGRADGDDGDGAGDGDGDGAAGDDDLFVRGGGCSASSSASGLGAPLSLALLWLMLALARRQRSRG